MRPRLVILAAGQGQRLRPLTEERPKCLLEVAGKTLLDWHLDAASRVGVQDIAVVGGYRAEQLAGRPCRLYHNPAYATTNMVETLWCAAPELHGEVIVAYGDILYEATVLQAVLEAQGPTAVIVDVGWRSYWERRFDDPLQDAESLRFEGERIVNIGQKVSVVEEIEGQYIGLMKFDATGLRVFEDVYRAAACRTMYMTDVLQAMVEAGHAVRGVPVTRQWLELDSLADFELAQRCVRAGPDGVRILL